MARNMVKDPKEVHLVESVQPSNIMEWHYKKYSDGTFTAWVDHYAGLLPIDGQYAAGVYVSAALTCPALPAGMVVKNRKAKARTGGIYLETWEQKIDANALSGFVAKHSTPVTNSGVMVLWEVTGTWT